MPKAAKHRISPSGARGASARRPTTRAGRAEVALAAIEAGRSRSQRSCALEVPFDQDRFEATAEALEFDQGQRSFFHGRTCVCLFALAELAEAIKKTVHTKGRASQLGKADLTAQNAQLLRLFDAKGNALYHRRCVMVLFRFSNCRYARLHYLAQMEHRVALVHRREVTDADVQLGRVVIPGDAILPPGPLAWFANLAPLDPVELRRRRGHGLEGRASNHAYGPEVVADFQAFVVANSAPNARREGTGHATFYFLSQFTHIEPSQAAPTPAAPAADASAAAAPTPSASAGSGTSLTEAFNAAQRAAGKQTISGVTLRRWLKSLFPRHAIHPHKSDYCDRCAELELGRRSATTTLQRLINVSSPADAVRQAQAALDRIKIDRQLHLDDADRERTVYRQLIAEAKRDWSVPQPQPQPGLVSIDGAASTSSPLLPPFTIAVDYMQEKPIPYFGSSAQPGRTYYLQKDSVHVFGAVQLHRRPTDAIDKPLHTSLYMTDEREDGSKTSDHLLSYLSLLVERMPPRGVHLNIYGDNAATIKSRYLIGWAGEMVGNGRLESVTMRFMVPGHTKFAPDQLFAHFGKRLQAADLFQVGDLVAEARHVADDAGEIGARDLRSWRKAIDEKYTDVKGIRDLRYLKVSRKDGKPVLEVASSSSPDAVAKAKQRNLFKAGQESRHLELRAKTVRGVEAKKHADLLFTYTHYVDRERHPAWIHEPPVTPEPPKSANVEEME
jgi:hypothetical protein